MFPQCFSNIYNVFRNNSPNWLYTDFNFFSTEERQTLTSWMIWGWVKYQEMLILEWTNPVIVMWCIRFSCPRRCLWLVKLLLPGRKAPLWQKTATTAAAPRPPCLWATSLRKRLTCSSDSCWLWVSHHIQSFQSQSSTSDNHLCILYTFCIVEIRDEKSFTW